MKKLHIYSLKTNECILVLFSFSLWLDVHAPHIRSRKDKNSTTCKSSTGEPIALYNSRKEWEEEHLKLYNGEANEVGLLEWKSLENKNLDVYCRQYLHQCVPKRPTDDAIGFKQVKAQYYQIENECGISFVEVVMCKIQNKFGLLYYMTRAPDPNCVYALKRTRGTPSKSALYLINKHCDFEQYDINKTIKWKNMRLKGVNYFHKLTGQPIAIDELLRQHELDHEEMHQKENCRISWPQGITNSNIHEYCLKYLQRCAPNKNFTSVIGSGWNGTIKYYKENVSKLNSTGILQCNGANGNTIRRYYFTRALEPNCVYALLRTEGKTNLYPFQIIYKHCDFETTHIKLETPGTDTDKNIKVDNSTAIETPQLFSLN